MYIFRIIEKKLRISIAGIFPSRLPRFYSTLDSPIEVPVQVAAYRSTVRKYIQQADRILDVGFGLGYGLMIMAKKAKELRGIETDQKAVSHAQRLVDKLPEIVELKHYDGHIIPYDTNSFDVVTCIDVIEHVPDYMTLLEEMMRVSNRVILLSTPNRLPENTRSNGMPKNRWHLREWSYEEFNSIILQIPNIHVDWNFLNGPWEGPFDFSTTITNDTIALAPALMLPNCKDGQ